MSSEMDVDQETLSYEERVRTMKFPIPPPKLPTLAIDCAINKDTEIPESSSITPVPSTSSAYDYDDEEEIVVIDLSDDEYEYEELPTREIISNEVVKTEKAEEVASTSKEDDYDEESEAGIWRSSYIDDLCSRWKSDNVLGSPTEKPDTRSSKPPSIFTELTGEQLKAIVLPNLHKPLLFKNHVHGGLIRRSESPEEIDRCVTPEPEEITSPPIQKRNFLRNASEEYVPPKNKVYPPFSMLSPTSPDRPLSPFEDMIANMHKRISPLERELVSILAAKCAVPTVDIEDPWWLDKLMDRVKEVEEGMDDLLEADRHRMIISRTNNLRYKAIHKKLIAKKTKRQLEKQEAYKKKAIASHPMLQYRYGFNGYHSEPKTTYVERDRPPLPVSLAPRTSTATTTTSKPSTSVVRPPVVTPVVPREVIHTLPVSSIGSNSSGNYSIARPRTFVPTPIRVNSGEFSRMRQLPTRPIGPVALNGQQPLLRKPTVQRYTPYHQTSPIISRSVGDRVVNRSLSNGINIGMFSVYGRLQRHLCLELFFVALSRLCSARLTTQFARTPKHPFSSRLDLARLRDLPLRVDKKRFRADLDRKSIFSIRLVTSQNTLSPRLPSTSYVHNQRPVNTIPAQPSYNISNPKFELASQTPSVVRYRVNQHFRPPPGYVNNNVGGRPIRPVTVVQPAGYRIHPPPPKKPAMECETGTGRKTYYIKGTPFQAVPTKPQPNPAPKRYVVVGGKVQPAPLNKPKEEVIEIS